jgi:Tol biopolymer transport system component
VWSPDGRRLAYAPVRSGTYDLFVKELTAGAPETQLLHTDRLKEARSWSPDGHYILFNTVGIDSGTDIWLLDVTGQVQPRLFAGGAADQRDGAFSPDGHWAAYVSSDSGRAEVYIRALDAGTPVQVSANGGEYPQWAADGRELYYVASDGRLTAVPITIRQGALEHGTPDPLFRIRGVRSSAPRTVMGAQRVYAVGHDGKRFLVSQSPAESPASSINVLFNWTAPEARR